MISYYHVMENMSCQRNPASFSKKTLNLSSDKGVCIHHIQFGKASDLIFYSVLTDKIKTSQP